MSVFAEMLEDYDRERIGRERATAASKKLRQGIDDKSGPVKAAASHLQGFLGRRFSRAVRDGTQSVTNRRWGRTARHDDAYIRALAELLHVPNLTIEISRHSHPGQASFVAIAIHYAY